jgi:hypothetical protein
MFTQNSFMQEDHTDLLLQFKQEMWQHMQNSLMWETCSYNQQQEVDEDRK